MGVKTHNYSEFPKYSVYVVCYLAVLIHHKTSHAAVLVTTVPCGGSAGLTHTRISVLKAMLTPELNVVITLKLKRVAIDCLAIRQV